MREEFVALIEDGELQMVTSKNGNVYAAARKASIPSTLEWEAARMVIGKELPGTIEKRKCLPYETSNSDGKAIILDERWEYVPEVQRTTVEEKQVITVEELEASEIFEFKQCHGINLGIV